MYVKNTVWTRIKVGECLRRDPVTVREDADFQTVLELAYKSRQEEIPLVTADGRLAGMLTTDVVREVLENGDHLAGVVLAADLAGTPGERVTPEDSLFTALRRLSAQDVDYLPVVDPGTKERLLGIVSRGDLMAAYRQDLAAEDQSG